MTKLYNYGHKKKSGLNYFIRTILNVVPFPISEDFMISCPP